MKTFETLLVGMLLCASACADVTIPLQEARAIKTYSPGDFVAAAPKLADGSIVAIQFEHRGLIYEDGTGFFMSVLESHHKSISCRTPIAYRSWFMNIPEKTASSRGYTVYCRIMGGETVLKSLELVGTDITNGPKDATIHWPKGL